VNINMLRDSDNDAGFYAAACAQDPLATWGGAVLYVSADEGASYQAVATILNETTMGSATNALGDFHGGNIVDELNSVNVVLSQGTLSSTTNAGLLNGANACVIGDEILQFRDATLESNGSYTLRGLLRGRRGSEYAMGGHEAGDRFVLVDVTSNLRITAPTSDIGRTKLYKAVSAGSSLASTTAQEFTNLGTGLKPYAPVHLGGGRDGSGNLTLTWKRRNRIDGAWRDLVDVPMSEASEAYVVRIFADNTYATVARTIEGITSPTTAYSAADQTTDFGSPPATVYFDVRQLSAVVGPGHAARASI
jgi:hypothetical protein